MVVTDSTLAMLLERVNNSLDGQQKIEGKLELMMQMQLTLASQQEQIKSLQVGQQRLFEKSDDADDRFDKLREEDITPLRDDMIGNRRAIRVLGIVGSLIFAASGTLYSQWRPWQTDLQAAKQARDDQLAKYSQDVGKELQSNDRRLTVLEFRANNLDQKGAK
ncbi:hypothetical protein G3N59_10650 [Paraburkholderia sp. Ac-20340]|uniref:hypothetical protein n=1 Tax=Paraburkholderia sp. Ac-20340 TaxID=2703888 RepID=UPI00197E2042|nr:hypothetical protein [Paraburkholderia sp. Ac-20340]MBN3853838.1 hypothetical protein [Paraburkholderia sp. Ac-20340]